MLVEPYITVGVYDATHHFDLPVLWSQGGLGNIVPNPRILLVEEIKVFLVQDDRQPTSAALVGVPLHLSGFLMRLHVLDGAGRGPCDAVDYAFYRSRVARRAERQ